jgi:hypothetical protein
LNTSKKNYTILLSLVFIGLGSWKLYEKFFAREEVATYQWILSIFLIGLGVYQLIDLKKSEKV